MSRRIWVEEGVGYGATERAGVRYFEGISQAMRDVTDQPSPTVIAGRPTRLVIEEDSKVTAADPVPGKPPYRVPSMAEIAELRGSNGYRAASTFSGCGGSCLGFEMAGFDVVWANEFDPEAQVTYRLNHPTTILDGRGIRDVTADEVLDAIGISPGELDLFDGSPPCSKFSRAGRRAKSWGKTTSSDSHGSAHQANVEDLFFDYIRLVQGVQPKVFVAENVYGLSIGAAKGYLINIIKALKECGYRVKVGDLDAQWLGVPQRRRRLIFVGVRNDLGLDPVFPTPLPYRYSVGDACPWLLGQGEPMPIEDDTAMRGDYAAVRHLAAIKTGEYHHKHYSMGRIANDQPSPTVLAGMGGKVNVTPASWPRGLFHPTENRRLSIAEVKRICSFPDDFELSGVYAQQWERCGNAVPPLMMRAVGDAVRSILDVANGRTA